MSIIFDKYIGKHLIEKTMERNNASNIAITPVTSLFLSNLICYFTKQVVDESIYQFF